MKNYFPLKSAVLPILFIITITAFIEFMMGRLLFCKCGVVSLWSGDIWSNQNSQQLWDPYTFTHILHGVLFYFFLWWAFGKRCAVSQRLVLAVVLESAWEILENSSFIIDRYREATISLDYYGDSILNSVSDIFAMMLGFWIASRISWKISLGLAVLTDTLLVIIIKDSLLLNIIMLIYPVQAIKDWQLLG